MKKFLLLFGFLVLSAQSFAQLTLTFPAKDGLMVTADWYPVSSQLPVILLCHQNGSSRGEFTETALRLNKFGFNCLALDQRVGDEMNGVKNETAIAAKAKKLTPKLEDAEMDIVAAVNYLFEKYNRPIVIMGSSYSASLALKVAAENPKVESVIVFSPGEYFTDKNFIASHIQTLSKPVFATSSREESEKVTDLLKDINSRIKIQYIPSTKGDHGAKVLWPDSPDNQEYWIALMSFLDRIKTTE
jgi:dienelactone hydrolase